MFLCLVRFDLIRVGLGWVVFDENTPTSFKLLSRGVVSQSVDRIFTATVSVNRGRRERHVSTHRGHPGETRRGGGGGYPVLKGRYTVFKRSAPWGSF